MTDLLASFETGFERPSLDNPILFSRYADETALLLTAAIGIIWGIAGSIVMLVVARILAAIFGNEFDDNTRIALADKIQQFPLPQAKAAEGGEPSGNALPRTR
jgi:hypothetical protein